MVVKRRPTLTRELLQMKRNYAHWKIAALLFAPVLALAACGDAGGSSGTAETSSEGAGGGGELEPLKIGFTATGGQFADMYVAKEMGFFEDYGIDAELQQLKSSSVLVPAVVSGDVDIAGGDGVAAARSILAGIDVRVVAASVGKNTLEWWADEDIEDIYDLVGKRIGITSPGSLSDISLDRVIAEYPDLERSDFQVVNLEGLSAMIAALESDAVDAITIVPPLGTQTRGTGHHRVLDTSDMPHLGVGYVVNPEYLEENRDLVERTVAALLDAHEFIQDANNREAVAEAIGKYSQIEDQELNLYAYDYYVDGEIYIPDMEVPVDTLELMFQLVVDKEGGSLDDVDIPSYVEDSVVKDAQKLRE